jgi:hypothetical protein
MNIKRFDQLNENIEVGSKTSVNNLVKEYPDVTVINPEFDEDFLDIEFNIMDRVDNIDDYKIYYLSWTIAVVVKNGTPIVIGMLNELFNPNIFQNMLVLPGHDMICCVNLDTGEYKKMYIR